MTNMRQHRQRVKETNAFSRILYFISHFFCSGGSVTWVMSKIWYFTWFHNITRHFDFIRSNHEARGSVFSSAVLSTYVSRQLHVFLFFRLFFLSRQITRSVLHSTFNTPESSHKTQLNYHFLSVQRSEGLLKETREKMRKR